MYGDEMTIELDRKSSDFGKARIGPLRIDIWRGAQPIVRYATQIATGEGKAPEVGGDIYSLDRKSRSWRALKSKLSPGAGTIVDYWTEEDFIGEPAPNPDLKAEAWNRMTPLLGPAMKEAYEEEGLNAMFLIGLSETVGLGTTTFTERDEPDFTPSGAPQKRSPANRFNPDGTLK